MNLSGGGVPSPAKEVGRRVTHVSPTQIGKGFYRAHAYAIEPIFMARRRPGPQVEESVSNFWKDAFQVEEIVTQREF
ncbi:hypothetical protein J2129_000330 [Methanofollis sp. W23]|nr:hypothetical protein [Methanofollis sp. W23]